MGLYHIYRNKFILAGDIENSKYFKLAKARIPKRMWDRFVDYIDDFIDQIQPSKKSDLHYATTAILLGYQTKHPKEAQEIHDAIANAACNHGKTHNLMLGTLVMWRFGSNERDWLCAEEDTGSVNEDGDNITRTYYWIAPPTAPRLNTAGDLAKKFNQGRR